MNQGEVQVNVQSCPADIVTGQESIQTVVLNPEYKVSDYEEAMILAKAEAVKRFEDYMLVSWYDRDRDFESPANASGCRKGCEENCYIIYGLNHGAKLKVDIEDGRFVFFLSPVEW